MARKEYQVDFVLGAKQNAEYSKTFQSAQAQLNKFQKEIDAFNRSQSDIKAYTKQQQAIESTRKQAELYQKELENIQREMGETEDFSSKLANSELRKKAQIEKTNEKLKAQQERLQELQGKLQSAEIDVNDLTGAEKKLADATEKVKREQEEAANAAPKMSDAFKAAGAAIVAAGAAKALKAYAEWSIECARAAVEFESAMAGVAKTTDFTEAELAAYGRELRTLSATELPAAATELAAVSEAAGQLGIAKENLLDFTRVMTDMGIATNLTSQEAATELAQFANITKMSADDFGRMGSTVVALGNNFATTERDIVNMSKNLAAASDLVGVSQANITGLATALSSLGIEAQAGGTSISKLMREFETMVATHAEELQDFANVAGMSAEQFADAWRGDAMGALSAFVDGLGRMQAAGQSSIATLTELGITESRQVDAISRLANSGGLLTKAVETSNTAWAENTALSAEAAKRYATTESQAQLAANAYMNLKVAVGDAYTPVLRTAYGIQQDVMNGLAKFAEENPGIVRAFSATAGVVGLAVVGLTAYVAITKIVAIANAAMSASFKAALGPLGLVVSVVGLLAGMWPPQLKKQKPSAR
jgi:TP901 family phage tail tape measure protein